MNEVITVLEESKINNEYVEDWVESGKKTMGTICCHVPEEIVHAAGMLPVRLRATGCTADADAQTWMSPFSCSFARSTLQYLMDGKYDFLDGLISSDGCLMAGRIYDNWRYINDTIESTDDYYVRMVAVPRIINRHTKNFFAEHLEQLVEDLEGIADKEITNEDIIQSTKLYNETRALIRELFSLSKGDKPLITGAERLKIIMAGMSIPKEEYNTMLRDYIDHIKERNAVQKSRARIMVIGSAIDDPEYFKVIEDTGALVVTDYTCYGSRYLYEPVELDEENVLASLAENYMVRPVCPRMTDIRPEIHESIFNMIRDFDVDGVIFSQLQYCEVWGAEMLFFHDKFKEKSIPILSLEREEIMTNIGQLSTRVEAFVEMLES